MSYQEQEVKLRRAQGEKPAAIALALQISEARVEQLLLGDYVVRVILEPRKDQTLFYYIEALVTADLCEMHRNDEDGMCFDIFCPPQNMESQRWALNLAKMLETRGIIATCAPRWRDA